MLEEFPALWKSSYAFVRLYPLHVGVAVTLGWVAGLTAQSAPAKPPIELRNYRLVFFDEFDTLDLGTVDGLTASKPHKWYEGVWFSHLHAPVDRFEVADSALSLRWKRGQQSPDSSISTFSRNNPNYHAWRYGYFEARMKWKPLEGAWPAFWLIPVPPVLDGTPHESGEIDIFEGQGSQPHTLFGTIHRWSGSLELASSSARNRFSIPSNTDLASYHTYGLLWAPGRVTWYFDGVPLHSEPTYEIFDKQDYSIVIGMQEGSNWKSGDLTGVTAQSLTLTVDWVRVWQR
ncbi:MAG: glycoside hydrolase family 16 protein [Bryobacteraceae bacterium]